MLLASITVERLQIYTGATAACLEPTVIKYVNISEKYARILLHFLAIGEYMQIYANNLRTYVEPEEPSGFSRFAHWVGMTN